MGTYRSDCCYAADIVHEPNDVLFSSMGLCPQCGESCTYNIVLDEADTIDNVERIDDPNRFTPSEKQTLKPIKDACMNSLSSSEPNPLGLTWDANRRDGANHIEFHAECGCAYHPKPKPHVHPCKEHSDVTK